MCIRDRNKIIRSLAQQIPQQMQIIEKNCYEQNPQNMDKFVSCMKDKKKKFTDLEEKFQFQLTFTQYKNYQCFMGAFNPTQINQCKIETKADIQHNFDNFLSKMKNL
eukprot:TRINITY_DN12330_c0_g1_i1.p3 TRINITY_DN12330_c0_g1~~TRINITY_DN12330_c0_g1_i1.p3  ORF type:complete len:107 (+),score=16.47 TRINITY_DN12330_c0_g1_i1:136-456(+)